MKQPDFFNKTVSEKEGIDVTLVRKVNSFFWKSVKKELSSVNHRSIFLKNFGTITISKNKLDKMILDEIQKIRKIKISSYYTETRRGIVLAKTLENLKRLLVKRNEIAIERYKSKTNELVK